MNIKSRLFNLIRFIITAWLLGHGLITTALPIGYHQIVNQAYANYLPTELGHEESISSNIVIADIQPQLKLKFGLGDSILSAPNESFTLFNTLTNTGNTPLTPQLSWSIPKAYQADITHLKVLIDNNLNGIADSADAYYNIGNSLPTLAPGESYTLLIVGETAATVPLGTSIPITLNVLGTNTDLSLEPASDSVDNMLHIMGLPSFDLMLSSPQRMAYNDKPIELDVDLSSIPNQDFEPLPITINHQTRRKIVMRYNLPDGMEFDHLGNIGNAMPLYHLADDPNPKEYVTEVPTGETVDAIAFAWDDLVFGQNVDLSFFVLPENSLPKQFSSELTLFYGFAGQTLSSSSNIITQVMQPEPSQLTFYANSNYTHAITESPVDDHYYIEVQAPLCNRMDNQIASYPLYVRSQISGGVIKVPMVQLDPTSNLFRANFSAIPWLSEPATLDPNQLKIATMDNLSASVSCNGQLIEGQLLIQAAQTQYQIEGVVFDAQTPKEPISSAAVALYYNDGSSYKLLNSTLSNSNGYYHFNLPNNINSTADFLLRVNKNDYYFPAKIASDKLTPYQVSPRSYGQPFNLDSSSATQKIDLPIQKKQQNQLFLSSKTNREEASYGDWVEYTAQYQSYAPDAFNQPKLYIQLPQGMSYVANTIRLNKKEISASNITQQGKFLIIDLPTITPNSSNEISYLLKVNNSAHLGEKISTLHIEATEGNSNNSETKIELTSGALPDEGVLEGMVYADCNSSKTKNSDELGIPYVRLYLEDGRYVVTDANGMYSIYGVSPNNHVVKLDTSTLPSGAVLGSSGNRNNIGAPSMQFVDMKKGELHRADFIITQCDPNLIKTINDRKKAWDFNEVEQQIKGLSSQKEGIVTVDHKSTESVLKKIEQYSFHPATMSPLPKNSNSLTKEEITNSNNLINLPLKEVLTTQDNSLNFIGLSDKQVMASEFVKIRVKGPEKNTVLDLSLNGKLVDKSMIGEKVTSSGKNIQAQEYVGVELKKGINQLTLTELDKDKQVVSQKNITVILPGELKQIELIPLSEGVADGATPLPIAIKLLDAYGNPINTPVTITLESSSGNFGVEDIDSNQNGVQTRINDGQGIINFFSDKPNIITIKASAENITKSIKVKFNASLRPLIAVGIVDGALNLNDLSPSDIQPITKSDPFQRKLSTVMGSDNLTGRTALFLKGKVKGNYLLTLAYDSDKQLTKNLDKQIDPSKYYPIYGDSSQNGQDAQSSTPLYLRLDKGSSYMLYGDYSTEGENKSISELIPSQVLGKYNRNASGGIGEYNGDNVRVRYFTAYTNYLHKQMEFQGKGISGPYDVDLPNYVKNSEKITLVTRDKQQPQKIISEQALSAGADYVMDIFGNSILFTKPIPSYDPQGNPIFIIISYDVDAGGKKYWFYGVDGQLEITKTLSIGANYISDQSIEADLQRLVSMRLQQKFSENHSIVAEAAQSRNLALINDMAYRIEWHLKLDKLDVGASWQRVGDNFTNSSAGVTAGIEDIKANLAWTLDKITLRAELLSTEKRSAQTALRGGALLTDFRINPSLILSVGLRQGYIDKPNDEKQIERDNVTSILSKLTWQPESIKGLSAYIEGEQSIQGDNRKILAIGSDYQLNSNISLYLKKQLLTNKGTDNSDSIPGNFGLLGNSGKTMTQFGMKLKINSDNNIYTEYRGINQQDGLDNQAAVGLNHTWKSSANWLINTNLEKVHSFTGLPDDESTAATLGIEYTPSKAFKTYNRFEWRDSQSTKSMLVALSIAHSLSPSFTALGSFIYAHEQQKSDNTTNQRIDARAGLAYRDINTNKLHLLARYQYHYDNKNITLNNLDSHVFMMIANYQYNPRLILSGRYGIKYQTNQWQNLKQKNITQLMMGRFTYDITDKIDAGCMASTLYGDSQYQYAYGCDIGYLVASNFWVSLGYNLSGFYDPDLSGSVHTQPGFYLNFKLRFDENAFSWLTE